MSRPIEKYWEARLGRLKEELEANQFEVHLAADASVAKKIVQEQIVPETRAKRIS